MKEGGGARLPTRPTPSPQKAETDFPLVVQVGVDSLSEAKTSRHRLSGLSRRMEVDLWRLGGVRVGQGHVEEEQKVLVPSIISDRTKAMRV